MLLILASLHTPFHHLENVLMYGKETIVLNEVTSAFLSHVKMKQDDNGSQANGLIVTSESSYWCRSESKSNRNRS